MESIMRHINIILPGKPSVPIGGYKVAYQYADYFASIGYDVCFIYPYVKHDFFKRGDVSLFLKIKEIYLIFPYIKLIQIKL